MAIQVERETLLKIGQGLQLARCVIADVMKRHKIYPAVGNVAFIDESYRDLLMLIPDEGERAAFRAEIETPIGKC